jgi:hypothetical protein
MVMFHQSVSTPETVKPDLSVMWSGNALLLPRSVENNCATDDVM